MPDLVLRNLQGVLVAVLVALAAQFLSEHYGSPAMLMALLLGIAVNFLSEEPRTRPGVEFASRGVLRLGVALLGARISIDMLQGLGPVIIGCVILGVLATIGFGMLLARLSGRGIDFGLLTGGPWRSAAPPPPWPSPRYCRSARNQSATSPSPCWG